MASPVAPAAQPFRLQPFPGEPAPAGLAIGVSASRDGQQLNLCYSLRGPLQPLRLPEPSATPRRLDDLWGEVRDSPAEKLALMQGLRQTLTAERVAAGSREAGRAVFTRHCGNCHRLFGSGGDIGPDLTGGDRRNLDYLLSNIVDPGAVVTKDFLLTRFVLADGRVINGIVVGENEAALTVQTPQDRQTIPLAEIESRETSTVSLMPDGLLQPLAEQEIVDLIAYLSGAGQVSDPSAGFRGER